jgi:hypothetical protein
MQQREHSSEGKSEDVVSEYKTRIVTDECLNGDTDGTECKPDHNEREGAEKFHIHAEYLGA